jgi:UDP-glucose 4-epimerase
MNVLVTGATGFVAGHLVPRLVADGHRVLAAGHDPARLQRLAGAEPLLWDLRRPEPDGPLPKELDAVVHLAQANVPFPQQAHEMFAVHVAATQRLLNLAAGAGARRFVFASTGSVYGGGDHPWREDDPTEGPGYYAATKVAAERLVRAYDELLPYTIFRVFTPYGPGQSGRLVPGLINRVRTGAAVTVAGGTGPAFNPIYVEDLVEVFAQSLSAEGSRVFNVGGDEALTIRQMAETIGRVLGRDPVIAEQPGTADRIVGDIAELRRSFRLPDHLTSFEEGIQRMVQAR